MGLRIWNHPVIEILYMKSGQWCTKPLKGHNESDL